MSEITTGKLAEDFKILIDDVEELVKATASQAGERVGQLRQSLEKKIAEGRSALAQRKNGWFERASDSSATTECCALKNTWAPLAIVIGAGVILGLLLRRE